MNSEQFSLSTEFPEIKNWLQTFTWLYCPTFPVANIIPGALLDE